MRQSPRTSGSKSALERSNDGFGPNLIDAMRSASSGAARLSFDIGRICLTYFSGQQNSKEWTAFALAEAEEELRRQPRRRS